MKRLILLSAVAVLAFSMQFRALAQPGYSPTEENLAAREQFENDRFGIFIHWGIYSMLGQGEWVMHNQNLNYEEYPKLARGFYPSQFDAAQWVKAIKASGAKYITITTRHHDGFSMFRSAASSYNVVDATPFGRDVIGELAKACEQEGIRLHFYYSHLDWGREDFYPAGRTGLGTGRPSPTSEDPRLSDSYLSFMDAQLTELLTQYGPVGAIWFDGVWDKDAYPREAQPEIWNLYHQYELIHSLQPACLIGNNHHLVPFDGEDIQIFERDIPGHNEAGLSGQDIATLPLETCQTMNRSWGYRISDTNYKSTEDLIRFLVRTAGKGANLLLNIGPRPDGTLPEEALTRLSEMGEWLSANGESIYGTKAGLIGESPWGVSTMSGNVLYLHVLDAQQWPGTLEIGAAGKLQKAELLGVGALDCRYRKGVLTMDLPSSDSVDMIVKLTFSKTL